MTKVSDSASSNGKHLVQSPNQNPKRRSVKPSVIALFSLQPFCVTYSHHGWEVPAFIILSYWVIPLEKRKGNRSG